MNQTWLDIASLFFFCSSSLCLWFVYVSRQSHRINCRMCIMMRVSIFLRSLVFICKIVSRAQMQLTAMERLHLVRRDAFAIMMTLVVLQFANSLSNDATLVYEADPLVYAVPLIPFVDFFDHAREECVHSLINRTGQTIGPCRWSNLVGLLGLCFGIVPTIKLLYWDRMHTFRFEWWNGLSAHGIYVVWASCCHDLLLLATEFCLQAPDQLDFEECAKWYE